MLPAPDLVIRCPREGCTAHYRVRQYASGNTFGARVWTDGRMVAPMWPEEPEVTRCDACGTYFWVHRAPEVTEVDWNSHSHRWNHVPYVRFLTPREYLEALASGSPCATPEDERRLRWLLWWADNDRYRQDNSFIAARSAGDWLDEEQARENRLRLFDLLDEREPGQRLAKAELARELGWFAHARELLDWKCRRSTGSARSASACSQRWETRWCKRSPYPRTGLNTQHGDHREEAPPSSRSCAEHAASSSAWRNRLRHKRLCPNPSLLRYTCKGRPFQPVPTQETLGSRSSSTPDHHARSYRASRGVTGIGLRLLPRGHPGSPRGRAAHAGACPARGWLPPAAQRGGAVPRVPRTGSGGQGGHPPHPGPGHRPGR